MIWLLFFAIFITALTVSDYLVGKISDAIDEELQHDSERAA